MKEKFLLLILLIISSKTFSQVAGYPDFEIIESTPIETNLDNPDIRDAEDVWLEMINEAKTSLDIEEFYLSPQKGEPLEDIIDAVIAAGKRGVAVRIIVDARMYKTYPETADMLGQKKNISLRIIDFGKLAGGVQHAKYFIVDGEEIYLGSQNFDWRSLKHIHELGVRLRHNDAVAMYRDIFELDWKLSEKNDPSLIATYLQLHRYSVPFKVDEGSADTLVFYPTFSPKSLIPDPTLWDETSIAYLINSAKNEVMCQILSYSPMSRDQSLYTVLDNALRSAAARSVKVKMIVADWGKATEAEKYLKDLSRVPNIEVKFSSIPEWSGGYVPFARVEHCKYLVVDSSLCWLGTSNWEKSYFYNTRNIGVVVQSEKIAGILRRIFLKSWDGPYSESVKLDGEYQARKHGEQK